MQQSMFRFRIRTILIVIFPYRPQNIVFQPKLNESVSLVRAGKTSRLSQSSSFNKHENQYDY